MGRAAVGRFLLGCALAVGAGGAFAQAAQLDSAFGTGGLIISAYGNFSNGANGILVQPDQKLLICGHSSSSFTSQRALLARYDSTGALDPSFGTGGTAVSPTQTAATDVALQPDGKLVMAGFGQWYIQLTRYHQNGTPDSSFGVNALVETDLVGFYSESAQAVVVQPDGRLLVAGEAQHNGNDQPYAIAARYLKHGALDTSFADNGFLVGPQGRFNAAAVQPDGKLLMAGEIGGVLCVAQYLQNGQADTAFGVGGMAQLPDSAGSEVLDLEVLSDGSVLACGWWQPISQPRRAVVAAFSSSGQLDANFGTGGLTLSHADYSVATALAVLPSAAVVAVGSVGFGAGDAVATWYDADGIILASVCDSGSIVLAAGEYAMAHAAAVDGAGRVVMAGNAYDGTKTDAMLARFTSQGQTNGAEVLEDNSHLQVYPNPSSGLLTLRFRAAVFRAEARLVDASGQTIRQWRGISGSEAVISTSGISPGAYQLLVLTDGVWSARAVLVVQ